MSDATSVMLDLLKREPTVPPRPPRGARCGVACRAFNPPDGIPMAGYSLLGKRGRKAAWKLNARAMVLEDDEGHVIAFVTADLMSASRYLHESVAAITRQRPSGLDVHQIVLMGTHTHTAPGGFYGNSLYDSVAQKVPGFQREVADHLAETIADAIEEAWQAARPARISIQTETLWGVSRNRSIEPFQNNPDAAHWNSHPDLPGYRPGGSPSLSAHQLAIDPRVVVLTAFDDAGARIGSLATFGCHNTALGARQEYYAPDWTGIAASAVESDAQGGAPVVLVGLSAAGDVSPLPPRDPGAHYEGPSQQGPDLANFVGKKVAQAILAVHSRPPQPEPITFQSWYEEWLPLPDSEIPGQPQTRIAAWEMGAPALAGAEDGRSMLYPKLAWEGMKSGKFGPKNPQYPKAPALGLFGKLLRRLFNLRPSPSHPLHVVKIGSHAFATVPGEPTVFAAFAIESALRQRPGIRTASTLSYAGDYAGYFTTREEYFLQHYEGGSTLYGAQSLNHLAARLAQLAAGAPFLAPGREIQPFTLAAEPGMTMAALSAPAAEPEGEVLASGGHREGHRVYAWWAWPAENAPGDALEAHLELRGSDPGEEALIVPPQEVQREQHWFFDREICLWTVTFELEVAPEGLSVVAVPRPPAPFHAEPVVISTPSGQAT